MHLGEQPTRRGVHQQLRAELRHQHRERELARGASAGQRRQYQQVQVIAQHRDTGNALQRQALTQHLARRFGPAAICRAKCTCSKEQWQGLRHSPRDDGRYKSFDGIPASHQQQRRQHELDQGSARLGTTDLPKTSLTLQFGQRQPVKRIAEPVGAGIGADQQGRVRVAPSAESHEADNQQQRQAGAHSACRTAQMQFAQGCRRGPMVTPHQGQPQPAVKQQLTGARNHQGQAPGGERLGVKTAGIHRGASESRQQQRQMSDGQAAQSGAVAHRVSHDCGVSQRRFP
jgi:hypothetical protein